MTIRNQTGIQAPAVQIPEPVQRHCGARAGTQDRVQLRPVRGHPQLPGLATAPGYQVGEQAGQHPGIRADRGILCSCFLAFCYVQINILLMKRNHLNV